ncbi:hypothetical protein SAY87_018589 [Trapa incisa]|uniref:cysteine dioxygenase n=1 Tax=Trapa incisa TaxID=236973 RepID=A0AAN7LCL6_9MYRT|nr:hypothetical protein SAY87_018589 [Trapa incisa]
MGITTTLAGRKEKELSELSRDTTENTRSSSKKNRRRQRKNMLRIHRLFDTCNEVFSHCGPNIIPSPHDVERLRTVLDGIRPEDLELNPDMPYFKKKAERYPAITYLHLFESKKFSMGIFCFPPSGVIPLHNHPGMTVFSKILFGTLHIKSYDWINDVPSTISVAQAEPRSARLAKMKVNSNFTAPCNTSILYPTDGGNMHCFTALTACAVLDVLGPPYSDPDGRHCTYYSDYPISSLSVSEEEREGYAWLEETEKPDEFAVVGALYRGPDPVVVDH